MTTVAAGLAAPGRSTSRVAVTLRDPVLRNGYTLTLGSAITSFVGLGFWIVTARHYDAATVGVNAAVISAMMMLGGVAQLNLSSALVRFLPGSGPRSTRLILSAYAAAAASALALAVGFVALAPIAAPSLNPLLGQPGVAVGFVVSTIAWTVFVLQDAVLIGLRRAPYVVAENAVFALAKIGLVVVLARLLPVTGIFVSWNLALLLSVALTNLYLFCGPAGRRRARTAPPQVSAVEARVLLSFAWFDWLGSLLWIAATTALPILVVSEVGPASGGYFAVAWPISYALYLVSANMGTSLVAETAVDLVRLADRCRRMILHTMKLLAVAVAAVVIVAPYLLRLFGPSYAAADTTLLRVLALSALPNLVTASAVAAARAQLRTRLVLRILGAVCVPVVVLSAVLLPWLGIIGVGLAWVATQTVVATVLLTRPQIWLPDGGTGEEVPAPDLIGAAAHVTITSIAVGKLRTIKATNDLTVVVDEQAGVVLKSPRTARALDQLQRQQVALEHIHRLMEPQAWRQLLPHPVDVRGVRFSHVFGGGEEVSGETLLPGVDGRTLLARDGTSAIRMVAAAFEAIGALHRLDSRRATIDEALLAGWIAEPFSRIRRSPSGLLRASDRNARLADVEDRLRAELLGQTVDVAWQHGDFAPCNVLFSADGARVQGIVDWPDAEPNRLPAVDLLFFVLAADSQLTRRHLGEVVLRGLNGGPIPDWCALPAHQATVEAIAGREWAVLTLAWLGHVSSNLAKSAQYERSRYWLARNVDTVVRRLA